MTPQRPGQNAEPASRQLILALPGNAMLARDLAAELRCEWQELPVHRFPDGEALVRIPLPVHGRELLLLSSLHQPDGKTLPLLFAADAARELGATRVGLVAPYLAYMRQDARFQPGEAITSRSYARLLSAGFDFLITVDPHLHRWQSLAQIYSIPTQVVASAPAIARWLRKQVARPLLVGPDEESAQWVADVAALLGAPWTVMRKQRQGDRDVQVELTDHGPWPGCTPVLLDDVASSGETLAAAAQALQPSGLPKPVCVVVHALMAVSAAERLAAAGLERLVSCDGIAHSSNQIRLAPALAQAIRDQQGSRPPGLAPCPAA